MADAPSGSASALAHDLHRIREQRGITLDVLHDETKIPLALLQQFERTGLVDHPMFNRVYLRSLVRAYADLVGIDTEEALAALDQALSGAYRGGLAAVYLDGGEDRGAEAEDSGPGAGTVEMPPGDTFSDLDQPGAQPDTPRRERLRPVAIEEESPVEASWDAVSPSPMARRVATRGRRREPVDVMRQTRYLQWGLVSIAVLVLAGAIWLVLSLASPNGNEGTTPAVAAVDTAATDTAATPEPPRPRVTLGDTINVVIEAARGPVQGIRITRDEDLRRPYWIEEGQSQAFPALQRIVIEGQLDVIRLLVEGVAYPTGQQDEQGRIVITRASAQAFLDTTQAAPVAPGTRQEPVQAQ